MKPIGKDSCIGFVGLGAMGQPMAGWLLQQAWNLHVYARRDEPARRLTSRGATRADSPRALASVCTLVLLCLSDDGAVEDVVFGPEGLEQALAPGSVVVDMSTIGARSARRFAQRLESRDVVFMDAPVSGGQQGAEAGTLACMIGGPGPAVDAVRDVLGGHGAKLRSGQGRPTHHRGQLPARVPSTPDAQGSASRPGDCPRPCRTPGCAAGKTFARRSL